MLMIGWEEASNFWMLARIGFLRQPAAHPIDARAHFVGRVVEVRAPREAEAHRAGSLGRRRVDLFEAGHRGQRLLERPHDQLFDFERPDAAVPDAHRDARIGHVRHQVDRQPRRARCRRAASTTAEIMNIVTGRSMARRGMLMDRYLPVAAGIWRGAAAASRPAGADQADACRRPRSASAPVGDDALAFVQALEHLDALGVLQARCESSVKSRDVLVDDVHAALGLRGRRSRCAARPARPPAARPSAAPARTCPGLRRKPGLGTSISITAVRVAASNTGATRLT